MASAAQLSAVSPVPPLAATRAARLRVLQSVPQPELWLGSHRPEMGFSIAAIGISTVGFLKRLVVECVCSKQLSMKDRRGGDNVSIHYSYSRFVSLDRGGDDYGTCPGIQPEPNCFGLYEGK
jgi:anti-sigma factor RsiW